MHYIRSFLKGCQICQLHRVGLTPKMEFENQINLSYASLGKLSCDIKYMYKSSTCHKFILVVRDEETYHLVTIPLYRRTSHKV